MEQAMVITRSELHASLIEWETRRASRLMRLGGFPPRYEFQSFDAAADRATTDLWDTLVRKTLGEGS